MKTQAAVLTLLVLCWSCAKPVDPLTCGEGTTRDGARCVGLPAITCSAGTKLDNGTCVTDPTSCAQGTHLEMSHCVVDATACAEGTVLKDGRCIVKPDQPPTTRWAANVRVCPPALSCYDPSLGLAGPQTVVVAYSKEVTQGLGVGIAVSTDDGATFAEKKELTPMSRYGLNPTLATDDSGNVLVVYTEYEPDQSGQSNGTGHLWLVKSTDKGATWGMPVAVTPASDTLLDYKPMLSRSGATWWLLFQRYSATDSQMMISKSDDGGDTWSDPFAAPGNPGSYGQFDYSHGLSPLADGHLMLGYQSIAYDLMTGGYVSQAGLLNIDPGSPGVAPSSVQTDLKRLAYTRSQRVDAEPALASDSTGQKSCFVFVDAPSRDFSLFTLMGPVMMDSKPKLVPLGASAQVGPSVALGPNGECEVAWLDNRRGGWELWSGQLREDGTMIDQEPVSDIAFIEDGRTSITTLTNLVISGQQRYAVWTDARDGRGAVYFSRGSLDQNGM